MSSARYHELPSWLHHQYVDVALLSETHWSYTSEWQTPHGHAIHTGRDHSMKDAASGLLLLVATRLCRSDQIAWHDVEPGRILHCRLHLHPRPMDVIGLYQYPWNTSTVRNSRRKQIWTSLQQLLKAMPNRDTLCLIRDLNCSLPYIPRLVGLAHFSTPGGNKLGPQHGDMSILANMLTDYKLVALNTWAPNLGATSYTHSGSSRIDFILVTQHETDNQAKQVGMLTNAPFLLCGAHHVPMITSVNFRYFRH